MSPQRDATLRISIENLLEGVQVIGFDWTYKYLNATAVRHGHRAVEELLGREIESCYPGIRQTGMFEILQRVMRTRQPERMLNEFVHASGERQWFELRIEPVPDGICVLSLDVTEHQQTAAQLKQAHKMEALGRLAGGVAHDFNNLLTAILGYSELVLDGLRDSELAGDVREIQKAGQRATRLTRQLLAFSRKQVLVPEVVNLVSLLEDMHPMLQRLMPDVEVSVVQNRDSTFVRVDPGQFEQVVLNLAVNARDAMPQGGQLELALRVLEIDAPTAGMHGVNAGAHAVLSVSDTGTGMDAEVLAQAFEPFFTTKDPDEGTGLGLATVHAVVQQSDGFITVESELGRGTTFAIHLPTVTQPVPVSTAGPNAVIRPGSSETVLIVEPDSVVRELMVRTLRGCGYTIREARTGSEAMATLEQASEPPDLLVTELLVPGMHGSQIAQHAVGVAPEIKVLYVSGVGQTGVLGSPNLSAKVRVLLKPFTAAGLAERVREALDASVTG